ncbi:hypothetical protein IKQ19_14200 [Candidatus Saccharibacteria bacterium]|nr:hypothetical protein [Candidatus Saccharibacteria bacterium]
MDLKTALPFILDYYDREANGKEITPPGLPKSVKDPQKYISQDCVKMEE